ncbi:TlpA family protein disulfide reductase [Pedobacter sp. MC2016-14]|uniref:TlpA family protein disulfide reductase n=1 Tax=Pedobacter sp. MC2016-14 TaxID=2897327 RepID=UPI001E4E972D|nr:TlpA disulfide reductase family protein [Pedobacter sp. MC2016-14]MCD0489183.1 TlpA family protein disulfide reductase [Pedobacter sp. MC2016-14]
MAMLSFAQASHPVSWQFSSEKIAPLTYKIKLQASVKEPYHIYPQQASGAGLGMPTEILFKEDSNVEFIGEMAEKGLEQTGDEKVPYYSKGVVFTQTLKLKSEKSTTLDFTIKYMACTNQMCLPPSRKQFTLALNDKGKEGDIEESVSTEESKEMASIFKYEDFMMADTSGKVIDSKVITSASKYTFVDFWASWCIPCRAQGRALIPLYHKYRSKGFDVIGVSLDTDIKAWKKAIEADKYIWTNLSDLKGFESDMSKRYRITAIPRNFLIDNKGVIVARDLHGSELEAKLFELL